MSGLFSASLAAHIPNITSAEFLKQLRIRNHHKGVQKWTSGASYIQPVEDKSKENSGGSRGVS